MFHRLLLVGSLLLTLPACAGTADSSEPPQSADVERDAVATVVDRPEAGDDDADAPNPNPDAAGAAVEAPANPAPRPAGFRVAGMVGQVNGRAIYAHQVLEPMREELRALGQRVSRRQFERRVEPMIYERLAEIVQNALILSEAERDLSEQERRGLTAIMQQIRAELIRQYGRGSPAVADRMLQQRTGQGLEQTLEDRRQQLLVDRYMQQTLRPRVNVTQRDEERYYHDNYDRFNPPATRTLRIIRAAGPDVAETVQERLEAGEPFERIAEDGRINAHRPSNGGLMADVPGEEVFGYDPLNEAMRGLEEGEHVGPVDTGGDQWFIKVEEIDRPEQRSFQDVQRQIRQTLQMRQLNELSSEYYERLLERGSYDSLDRMAARLVEIATNRYAAPEDS